MNVKQIEIDCHLVSEKIRVEAIQTAYAFFFSRFQLADIFTKAIGKEFFLFLSSKLGIIDIHASI